MAFPIAHTLVGWSLGVIWQREPLKFNQWQRALWWSIISVAPDFDYIQVLYTGDYFVHRGPSHSLIVALAAGVVLASLVSLRFDWRNSLLYVLIISSHTVLDWSTTRISENGPMILWPFTDRRFALGWWEKSGNGPYLYTYFRRQFYEVIGWELVVFLPLFLIVTFLVGYYARAKKSKRVQSEFNQPDIKSAADEPAS